MEYVNNVEWLYEQYKECNRKYFNNELPHNIEMKWSERMTSTAGNCRYTINDKYKDTKFEVTLSSYYHRKYSTLEEALNTLIHEMIHVKYPKNSHGELFYREMNRINKEFNLEITRHSKGAGLIRYNYVCEECDQIYERTNAIKNYVNYTCQCNGKLTEISL